MLWIVGFRPDARGTARDGLPYENTYAWFLEIRDDKVTKASAFFDSIDTSETFAAERKNGRWS
jgi:ketosteroid isomerase-like protein